MVFWWETVGPGRLCEFEQSVTNDFVGDSRGYATVEDALARFGRYPGIRGDLPPESLVPTDEGSPEFGATLDSDAHPDTVGGRTYNIWKNGDVVQSVSLDRHSDRWVNGGYSGCSPIP